MHDFWEDKDMHKKDIDIIQINLGNRCNLSCRHCHIEASPAGSNTMDRITAEKITAKLRETDVSRIEFTGGEPILIPNLTYFIEELSGHKDIAVRTNLVSLGIP